VRVRSLTGWWIGGKTDSELIVRAAAFPSQEFLVAKAIGATQTLVLSFAVRLQVRKMHVVNVGCLPNCG
jgi:hypothetical protein